MSNPVLVGVNDLFFSAKITGPANVLGVPMKCFPSCDRLLAAAREAGSPPPLVILDLESVGGDPVSLIRAVKSDEGLKDARVVAFGRHTNAETLQAADDAGADQVMPRSDFVQVLPDLLRACADGARTALRAQTAPRAQTGTESSP
jgi:DNA-binding NarL/FixJ family response regulator